jgi:hypothetical protein
MKKWVKINLCCLIIIGVIFFIKFHTPLGHGDIIAGVLHLHHSSVGFYSIVLSVVGVYSLKDLPRKHLLALSLLWVLFDVFVCLPQVLDGIITWHNGILQIVFLQP